MYKELNKTVSCLKVTLFASNLVLPFSSQIFGDLIHPERTNQQWQFKPSRNVYGNSAPLLRKYEGIKVKYEGIKEI